MSTACPAQVPGLDFRTHERDREAQAEDDEFNEAQKKISLLEGETRGLL